MLANKGNYLLILFLKEDRDILVGRLGKFKFKRGYYVYVGSALNSLTDRVKRHFSKEKKKHWHIDYLLDFAIPLFAILIPWGKNEECNIAKNLKGKILVKKFGSSDSDCESHLLYYKSLEELLLDLKEILKWIVSSMQIT